LKTGKAEGLPGFTTILLPGGDKPTVVFSVALPSLPGVVWHFVFIGSVFKMLGI
jgi:hypothetical protein